ncbi:MAG: 1-acyl-sn-glycerol-3-phosphate acyltransferase [Oscillospiraceae bacterium]|nr:1-acyl-sn-glycerol-3-phosphate acyltransferase [Oscillospiraceae bacterium]
MSRTNTRPRNTVKAPNGVIYFALYFLFYPFLKLFFRLQVDRTAYQPPKDPMVVLSNHESFMDFLLVMLTIYPLHLNAVTAQKFFLYRPLNWLLPFMGCIPKSLFEPDIRAVKSIFSVIRRGGHILIFPEGRCSTDGGYMGANQSIGKLVKKLEVPVISCRIEGAYTCMPFWRDKFRRGRIRVTLANLFDPEDTRRLSADTLTARIDARLCGKDALAATHPPLHLSGARRLAEGLENILYYCPACQQEFTLETKGNIIRCRTCHTAAEMGRDAKFTPLSGGPVPETVHLWHKAQVRHEMQSVHEDMAPIEVQVKLRMPGAPGKGLAPSGHGTLRLDATGWYYDGLLHGAQVSLFFPIQSVPAIPYDPADNFQIYAGGEFYVFTPEENLQACSKYAVLGECVYRRCSPVMQMTAGEGGFDER